MKFHQGFNNFHDELNYLRQSGSFKFEEDNFSKIAQGIALIMRECLLLLKRLQTESEIKFKKTKYSDLYYTVSEIYLTREENEI